MEAEKNFIKEFEFEKRIEIIMSAYYNQFKERLSIDKYREMVKNYYESEVD